VPSPFTGAQLLTVTAKAFTSMAQRLGLATLPAFFTSNYIQPVALVDTDPIPVTVTQVIFDVPFTQGDLASPVAGTLMADTGALAGGSLNVLVQVGWNAGAGNSAFDIARRNAANNADVWKMINPAVTAANDVVVLPFRLNFLANERLIVRVSAGGGFGVTVRANIFASS
jgi:hypothetical protein